MVSDLRHQHDVDFFLVLVVLYSTAMTCDPEPVVRLHVAWNGSNIDLEIVQK